jgi:hypothetical protein
MTFDSITHPTLQRQSIAHLTLYIISQSTRSRMPHFTTRKMATCPLRYNAAITRNMQDELNRRTTINPWF